MLETVSYKPSPWGQVYHNARDADGRYVGELLGGGSAGPGKTFVLLMDPLEQIVQEHNRAFDITHPHRIEPGKSVGWALHMRRTNAMLTQTIQKALRIFPQLDPGIHWDANAMTFRFSSGYHFQFGHCAESGDWQRYQGLELTHLAADELTQFEEEQIDQVSTRVRTTDRLLARLLKKRYMSNPVMQRAGETFSFKGDPAWVRKRFVEPYPTGGRILRQPITLSDGKTEYVTRMYLPAKLADNPDPEFARRYEIELRAKKPHIRKALLDGDWFITEGAYYEDVWEPSLHVCKPFKVPDWWPMWRAMDWGFKVHGVVGWYAMDDEGNVHMIRELTFKGKTDVEVSHMVRDAEMAMGVWDTKAKRSRLTGPADNQLWEQRGDHGANKAVTFATNGVPWFQADKKSLATNAMHIYRALQDRRGGTPGLVLFDTCVNTVKTLPMVRSDKDQPDYPVLPTEDHWYDQLAYSMAYASRGRSAIVRVKPEDDDDDDDDDKPTGGKYSRFGYGSVA